MKSVFLNRPYILKEEEFPLYFDAGCIVAYRSIDMKGSDWFKKEVFAVFREDTWSNQELEQRPELMEKFFEDVRFYLLTGFIPESEYELRYIPQRSRVNHDGKIKFMTTMDKFIRDEQGILRREASLYKKTFSCTDEDIYFWILLDRETPVLAYFGSFVYDKEVGMEGLPEDRPKAMQGIYNAITYARILEEQRQLERLEKKKQARIPYYDGKCWNVDIDGRTESGDLSRVVSEYIRDWVFYDFSDGDHAHSFEGVLEKIINNPELHDIEGVRSQYSAQELEIIEKLKKKLKMQCT